MADLVTVRWHGDAITDASGHAVEAMLKEFAAFDRKKAKAAVRKATRAAVKDIVMPEAKKLAPKRSGALVRSLKVRAKKRSRVTQGHNLWAGAGGEAEGLPFYALFQEFGWRPRNAATGPFRGAAKRAGVLNAWSLLPTASPFLRPALYNNAARIYRKIVEVTRREMFK